MINKENNYAFIDGQNLNLGIQELGWRIDLRKLVKTTCRDKLLTIKSEAIKELDEKMKIAVEKCKCED